MVEANRGLGRPPIHDAPDPDREGLARKGQAALAGAVVRAKIDLLSRRARAGLEGGCHRPPQ